MVSIPFQVQHPVRLVLLLAGALATTVLFVRGREQPARDESPRLNVGYYVRDARLTGTGPDGRILYRVRAADVEQDLADGSVAMADIAVDYEPATDVPWTLTAREGRIPPGGNIIVLTGDVVASTPTATPPTLIRTDYLELDPDSYLARTAGDVTIERARDTLRARGMRIFLRQDRLELESEVQGVFRR